MPNITPALLHYPAPPTLFTGVIAMSRSAGGCDGSGDPCTLVTFVNGVQQSAQLYSGYLAIPQSIPLPINFTPGPIYYNQIPGDTALLLCDPSRYCGKMTYKGTIGAIDQPWPAIITRVPLPPPPPIITGNNTTTLQTQILALQNALAAKNATIADLRAQKQNWTSERTALTAALSECRLQLLTPPSGQSPTNSSIDTVAKLLDDLSPASCPPPPNCKPQKTPPPPKGCCGVEDTVAASVRSTVGCEHPQTPAR